MPIDPNIPQCKHIKVNGLRCGSPSLRGRKYCYFHYEVSRPLVRTDIPVIEDINSVQYSLNRLAEYILEKRIDYRQASLLLWLMQIASANARHTRLEPLLKEDVVRDHPDDSYFPNPDAQSEQDSEIAVSSADLAALGESADPLENAAEPFAEDESVTGVEEPAAEEWVDEGERPHAQAQEQEPRESSAISAGSALKAVNPKPETRNPKPDLRKPPTREELDEIAARAIERFRNTPPIEDAAPGRKRRRKPQ